MWKTLETHLTQTQIVQLDSCLSKKKFGIYSGFGNGKCGHYLHVPGPEQEMAADHYHWMAGNSMPGQWKR